MHITAETHPKLCEALKLMIHDHGGNHRFNPDHNQPCGFQVPSQFDKYIDRAEQGLSRLTGDQMDTFASGVDTEMAELIASDPCLSDADTILSHCFDHYSDGVWLAE